MTIKNVRRNEYLTNLAATGKNNTMTTVTERGKWVILRDNADFILLNPEAGAFCSKRRGHHNHRQGRSGTVSARQPLRGRRSRDQIHQ